MEPLKQLAIARLKPTSYLRTLILSEPDILPPEEAKFKAKFFAKLLYMELAN
jgi:hypothetical protein